MDINPTEMAFKIFIRLLVIMLYVTSVRGGAKQETPDNKIFNGLFELDIKPGVHENEEDNSDYGKDEKSSLRKRAAVRSRELLWENGYVFYVKGKNLDGNTSDIIDKVMRDITSKTCIKFLDLSGPLQRTPVKFESGLRCSSEVGRQGSEQKITITSECSDFGAITRLILHTLGLWPEHSRPDRDKYIEILWENIYPGEEYRFDKQTLSTADDLGLAFDYESITFYGNQIFAINESLPTMRSITPGSRINPGQGMSVRDIQKLNTLYACTNENVSGNGEWSSFGPCNVNCRKQRQRLCPQCTSARNGVLTETRICSQEDCHAPVPGSWGRWSFYSCETNCSFGRTQTRTRRCNDPPPRNNGSLCVGSSTQRKSEECFRGHCELSYYDCEFEKFQKCYWQNIIDSQYRRFWQAKSGGTPSVGTGPYSDATVGTPEGIYMYFETSSPVKSDDRIAMKSPTITTQENVCFIWKYHMYGANMGTLNVRVNDSNSNLIVWSKSGNQGKFWQEAYVDISRRSPFQIILEGVSGMPPTSDMAVDDLRVRVGDCTLRPTATLLPPTPEPSATPTEPSTTPTEPSTTSTEPSTTPTEPLTTPTEPLTSPTEQSTTVISPTTGPTTSRVLDFCDFNKDYCGWTSDYFIRTRRRRGRYSSRGHRRRNGYYLITYGHALLEKEFNDVSSKELCLQFWYFRKRSRRFRRFPWRWYRRKILEVILEETIKGRLSEKRIVLLQRSTRGRWKFISRKFNISSANFKIIFENIGRRLRVALDDIKINIGSCSPPEGNTIAIAAGKKFFCGFSRGNYCGFHHLGRHSLSFTCSREGYLLLRYFRRRRWSRRRRRRRGIIISPIFSSNSVSCLQFSYKMMSRSRKSAVLKLFVRKPFLRKSTEVLWQDKLESGSWLRAQVEVRNTGQFQLGFAGIIQTRFYWRYRFYRAKIGIDNFMLSSGHCPVIQD